MIASTGIIGLCLVVGGLRHRELEYRIEGTSPRSRCWLRWRH